MQIFKLGQPDQVDSSEMGGKAHKLHLLKGAGFNVPGGFTLSQSSKDLMALIKEIGGFPVAVRSSGAMEDLAQASFAGLYDTFLFIENETELYESISKCFESKNSERVQDYLKTKNLTEKVEILKMSVLVQKMVKPLMAGVLFTLNPTNGKEEEFYLEYCSGVGERLVSGHVTPTTCNYNIQTKKIVSEVVNSEGTQMERALLEKLIQEAKKIQAHFGAPQDIEWAIDECHELHILQSRPITSVVYRDDVPEMTNADLKDGGVSARVCTPVMFSAYRKAMQFSMGDYFKKINLIKNPDEVQWIYHLYGRVYWNAGVVKEGLKQIPDFNEQSFDRDLGIQKDYGTAGPHITKTTVASVINAIPVLIGLKKEFADCVTMVDQFRDQFEFQDAALKEELSGLGNLSIEEFKNWFLRVIHFQVLTERNYFRTIYNNSNFQTEFKSFLKKQKAYLEGDEIELMSQLTGVSHLDVQADLEKLAKVADFYGLDSSTYFKKREEFLSVHYHHGPAELDLTVERWGERKDWVDELVKALVSSVKKESHSLEETIQRLEKEMGFLSKLRFEKNLQRSRHFLVIREEMRAYSTRAYYLLRKGLLEFARRWQISSESVFMLDLDEVSLLLTEPKFKMPDLSERLLSYRAYRNFNAPNEFGGAIVQQKTLVKDGVMKGLGCSPGKITGRARVILDIHQTTNLNKEDILVTLFTDPGWTPVLARVGGVVTEVGGLLSHAAVIGREYGIPAVLNLNGATKLIKDGCLISIDGKTGEVSVLEESP